MESLKDMITKQTAIAKNIEQMASNFKKDSASRKTLDYLNKRLQSLETLFNAFTENHSQLMKAEDFGTSDYATSKFFERVETGVERLRDRLSADKQSLINTEIEDEQPSTDSQHENDNRAVTQKTKKEFDFTFVDQEYDEQNDDAKSEEIKQLVLKIHSMLTILVHLIEDIQIKLLEQQSKQYLQLKINTIQHYWNKIEELNALVWSIIPTSAESFGYTIQKYYESEELVHNTLIEMSQKIDEFSETTTRTTSNIQLPKITLPVFDGDYLKWNQFQDIFTQLIHDSKISNSEKMFYLSSNVTGEARLLIQHLPVSNNK